MSKAAAEVGSTANSYQILAKLATGGMADIFLARGEGVAGVERYCVLKRILQDRASDVHFVQMFLDEARLAAQLQHPNIAQVYDIGKLGDSYFFTMEYVHGETVRALLHRAQGLRRRLPIACVLTIAAGTAAGLHHAHTRLGRDGRALGIVHRDVSPSNLMVSYEGGVKVVDFGVAKAADRAHETKSGTVKGKISYLSPEQCKGKRVDRRSDLFSLGICVWEMLTTERLYKRTSDFDNMNAIVTEPTPLASSRRSDVPPEVDELVARLLAKTPEERFQTADELVDTIEDVASRTGSVLSSAALGRFVRELFGQRPEPWLELETGHEPGEAITVTSEPIPQELVAPAAENVNRQLASVVDLSTPRSVTESLGSQSPEVPTTRLAKRATLGFPLAAPPATHPTGPDSDPAPALPPPPSVVRPTVPLRPGPARALEATESSGELLVPPPSSGPQIAQLAVPSGTHALPSGAATGSLVASTGSPSGSFAMVSGPQAPVVLAGSGPRMASAGPFVSPASSHDSLRASASHDAASRRRVWPLYVVIASAALLGSGGVIVMMRAGAGASAAEATSTTAPRPLDRAQLGAVGAPRTPQAQPGTITVVPIDPPSAEPVSAEPVRAEPVRAEPVSAGPGEPTVSAADTGGPGGRPLATPRPTARDRAATPPRPVVPATNAMTDRSPANHEPPQDDEIARAFKTARYGKVVELCGAGPVSAEHAPICIIAACDAGNEDKGRKFLIAAPAAKRDQLIAHCKQLGVDIANKKPAKPAVDCEADPMACQH